MRILILIAINLALCIASLAEKKVIRPTSAQSGYPFTSTSPFSAGLLADGTLYVSGTVSFSKERKLPESFEAEMRQCLDNVGAVLNAAEMTFAEVVSVQVHLTDVALFERMNAVYATYFKEPYPTRTTVGNAKFAVPARVEVTVTAHK